METRTRSDLTHFTPTTNPLRPAGAAEHVGWEPSPSIGNLVGAVDAVVVVLAVAASLVVGAGLSEDGGGRVVVPVGALVSLLLVALLWNSLLVRTVQWQAAPESGGVLEQTLLAAAIALVCSGMIFVLARAWGLPGLTLGAVAAGVVASTAITAGVRVAARVTSTRMARRAPRSVVIVGTGPRACGLFHQLRAVAAGYRVVGFVDERCCSGEAEIQVRLLGCIDDLEAILMRTVVDEVLVALPVKSHYSTIQRALHSCERVGVPVSYAADLYEYTYTRPRYGAARPFPAVTSRSVAEDDHRLVMKRVLDVVVASIALVVISPLLACIAAAVRLTSKGPVLFVQERHGLHKRRFRMLKFRTMVVDAERLLGTVEHLNEASGPVFKIRHDPRLTPIGSFLRKWSLDELPQLWNVIRGDMSLVGPRPMSVRDVTLFDEPWLMRRFSVRPGVTCLWQVSGRSNLTFDDWISLDLAYIDSWSLALDMKILMRTLPAVMRGSGAM